MSSTTSIVIPTRDRPRYLEVAVASIAPQARDAGADVLIVEDREASAQTAAIAARHGARHIAHDRPLGLNHARNTGIAHTDGELLVFVDDDVEVAPGWLKALVRAFRSHPEIDVFAGPIHPRLEGHPPRSCGRERPPITALDLGARDTTAATFAWGTNMAIRRSAFERVGTFDVSLRDGGDEQEWQERVRERGGEVLYVAAAAVDHRRAGDDVGLRALMSTAFARGRAARRLDAIRGKAPSRIGETLTLARCAGHVALRRCPAGLTMVAHSGGRIWQALIPDARMPARDGRSHHPGPGRGERAHPRPPRDGSAEGAAAARHANGGGESDAASREGGDARFLSGESGTVGGAALVRARALDRLDAACELASGRTRRLARAAATMPARRRVLVLGAWRPERAPLSGRIRSELLRSRHDLTLRIRSPGNAGKFENLNALLEEEPAAGYDWLLLVDDDVVLGRGFLDRLLFLAERFAFDLAQPAHPRASNAAWKVTRRQRRNVARETGFVEIGPVTALARSTFDVLLPFPPLRMGWGLDAHWSAVAREHGWRCGVIDAVTARHVAPAGGEYSRHSAIAEARAFLAGHPHLGADEAQRTIATHRRW